MAGLPPETGEIINTDDAGRRIGLEAGCYATFGIAVVFVLVRVYNRRRIAQNFQLDDMLLLAGTLMSACYVSTIAVQFRNGIGKPASSLSTDRLYTARKWAWISEIFYYAALGAIKASIAALYHYHAAAPVHKKVIIGFGALVFLHGLAAAVITTTIGKPVLTSPGHPEGLRPFNYFNTGFLILTDFILTMLPIPILQATQLSKEKKIGLGMVYCVGVLTIAASIARQVSNINSLWTTDFTWDYPPIVTSGAIEINLALICATITALRHVSTDHSNYELNDTGSLGDNAAGYSARIFPTKTPGNSNESEERIVPQPEEGTVVKTVEYRLEYH